MQICFSLHVFQLTCSKITEITKKKKKTQLPTESRMWSAWMDDHLCIIPTTEKYPHLGMSCPLTVGGKVPPGSQWAWISTVVLYQEKPIQRDKCYISTQRKAPTHPNSGCSNIWSWKGTHNAILEPAIYFRSPGTLFCPVKSSVTLFYINALPVSALTCK